MGVKESASLKLAQHDLGSLPGWRDSNRFQQTASFTLKLSGIQEVTVGKRREIAEQKCTNVNRPIPRAPFEALEPPCDVFGRRRLSASIAGQGICDHRWQARIVVQKRKECKLGKTFSGPLKESSSLRAALHNAAATAVRRGWLIGFWRRTTAVARCYLYLQLQTRDAGKSCIERGLFALLV
jgi:hypothetical protein